MAMAFICRACEVACSLSQDEMWPEHCMTFTKARIGKRAHPDLNQGPADLQSAALTTELCTHESLTVSSANKL